MKLYPTTLSLLTIVVINFSTLEAQEPSMITHKKEFTVVANLDYGNPFRFQIPGSIEAFCKTNGNPPQSVKELLNFCITYDYHPNDIIIDDFRLNQLRIKEDYNGFFLIYFIGPDGVDNNCKKVMTQEEINGLRFESYLTFEGDIVLGGLDKTTISAYQEKFQPNDH